MRKIRFVSCSEDYDVVVSENYNYNGIPAKLIVKDKKLKRDFISTLCRDFNGGFYCLVNNKIIKLRGERL